MNKLQCVLSIIGGFLAGLLGGFDVLLQTLLIFIVLDYITGIAKAIKKKSLSSYKGFWGGAKKAGILLIIVVAYRVDLTLGTDVIRNGAVIFFIANEGISILENSAVIGVKIPKKLRDVLEQIQNKE